MGFAKVVIGLILIIGGVLTYWYSSTAFSQLKALFWLVVGNIPAFLILIGLVVLLMGFSDVKS